LKLFEKVETMNESSVVMNVPVVNPRKPGVGWRLANHNRQLCSINRRGQVCKINKLVRPDGSARDPIKVTSIPGCNIEGREHLRLGCKRLPSKMLFVTISRTVSGCPGVTETVIEFFLEEGEFCELVGNVAELKQEFVRKLTDFYADEKDGTVEVKTMDYDFFASKLTGDRENHDPHKACTLHNDGKHIHAVHNGKKVWLRFRDFDRDVCSNKLPWMNFLHGRAMFKFFGHTLSGDAIVLLHDSASNWMITFAISKGWTANVWELRKAIAIGFSKE
jgi:hypothetical protein